MCLVDVAFVDGGQPLQLVELGRRRGKRRLVPDHGLGGVLRIRDELAQQRLGLRRVEVGAGAEPGELGVDLLEGLGQLVLVRDHRVEALIGCGDPAFARRVAGDRITDDCDEDENHENDGDDRHAQSARSALGTLRHRRRGRQRRLFRGRLRRRIGRLLDQGVPPNIRLST